MSVPAISAFHVSGLSNAKGKEHLLTPNRKPNAFSGIFHLDMDVHFDPAVDHIPAGTLSIQTNMVNGEKSIFIATSIELINSHGKHNPTVYLSGICRQVATTTSVLEGCRYWLMVTKNTRNSNRTLDVIGFCIHDQSGNRIAYGANL